MCTSIIFRITKAKRKSRKFLIGRNWNFLFDPKLDRVIGKISIEFTKSQHPVLTGSQFYSTFYSAFKYNNEIMSFLESHRLSRGVRLKFCFMILLKNRYFLTIFGQSMELKGLIEFHKYFLEMLSRFFASLTINYLPTH